MSIVIAPTPPHWTPAQLHAAKRCEPLKPEGRAA